MLHLPRSSLFVVLMLIVGLISSSNAQIACDEAYGSFCPEESGWAVGDCLKKLPSDSISADCAGFIQLHDACRSDLETNCPGKEYTSDAILCLTEWTKGIELTESCVAALPKKSAETTNQAREADKLGSEAKRKADQRRKIRNKAAKRARAEQDEI